MFNEIIKRPFYRKKHIDAPLLEERIKYLQHLKDRGRSLHTIKDAATYLLRIIELLRLRTRRIITYKEIEAGANAWAQYQYNHPQKRQEFSNNSKDTFVRYAIEWLKLIGCLERPPETLSLLYKIFERKHAINRHTTAPFLKERIKYLRYWEKSGATVNSLREIAQYLLRVIEYINLENKKTVAIDEIKKVANKWARYQSTNPHKRIDYSEFARKRFIRHASGWLSILGYLKPKPEEYQPFSEILFQYVEYMRNEQGLSEETVKARIPLLKHFLKHVWIKIKSFNELTILIIDGVIAQKKNIDGCSRRTIQNYISVVRSFLRHAEQKAWCRKDLTKAIKIARVYRHESLPYSPSWDEVKKLLKGTEGDNPTNIRDRAILMLLAVYGLRRIEVARLTLDDIDWKKEQIHLNRAKNCKPQQFPLSATVGEVILRYIKEVRPNNCSYRNIFICKRAPLKPLSADAIYAVVNRRWKSVDAIIKHYGPHSLRHACATHLINEGVSLKEISDHLGHSDIEATRIYAKVDLVNLRKVSEFDVGDLL